MADWIAAAAGASSPKVRGVRQDSGGCALRCCMSRPFGGFPLVVFEKEHRFLPTWRYFQHSGDLFAFCEKTHHSGYLFQHLQVFHGGFHACCLLFNIVCILCLVTPATSRWLSIVVLCRGTLPFLRANMLQSTIQFTIVSPARIPAIAVGKYRC